MGHVPPPGRLETLGPACLLDHVLEPGLAKEAHGDPGAGSSSERRRERQQHARSVARDPVRGPGAAVRHRREAGQRAVEELARGTTVGVRDQADATGVALALVVVEKGARAQRCLPPFQVRGNGMWCLPPVCLSASPAEAGEDAG